jgi:hypothetical protein
MSEKVTPVQTVLVDYVCDSCGEGEMRPTGLVIDTYPQQYPHFCSKCGTGKTFPVTYPMVRHIAQGEWKPAEAGKTFTLRVVDEDAGSATQQSHEN